MFENASELIIYSGHLLQLWDLNSIQQLTQDDDDNVRVERKPSKVDPKWYVAGWKFAALANVARCSSLGEEEDIMWTVQKGAQHW